MFVYPNVGMEETKKENRYRLIDSSPKLRFTAMSRSQHATSHHTTCTMT